MRARGRGAAPAAPRASPCDLNAADVEHAHFRIGTNAAVPGSGLFRRRARDRTSPHIVDDAARHLRGTTGVGRGAAHPGAGAQRHARHQDRKATDRHRGRSIQPSHGRRKIAGDWVPVKMAYREAPPPAARRAMAAAAPRDPRAALSPSSPALVPAHRARGARRHARFLATRSSYHTQFLATRNPLQAHPSSCRSWAGKFVKIPSTPHARSRRMSAGSSTVKT